MEPQQIILACKTYTPSVPKCKTFGICTTFPESLCHCTNYFLFPKKSPDVPRSVSGLSSLLARSPEASSSSLKSPLPCSPHASITGAFLSLLYFRRHRLRLLHPLLQAQRGLLRFKVRFFWTSGASLDAQHL